MNALTRISIALFVSALMLTGCASSTPGLYVDSSRANLKSPPMFSDQETPTIRYSLPEAEVAGVAIKVVMQPEGIAVRRQYAAQYTGITGFDDFEDSGFEIDHPTHFGPVAYPTRAEQKMEFPGLCTGNYTAELWVKGRKEGSLNFSVGNSDNQGSFRRHSPRLPGSGEVYVPPATAKIWASRKEMNPAVAQIDTFVGLTDEQKAEVTKIYLNGAPLTMPSSASEAQEQLATRKQIRERVRALLSPEQQKLYDDDGSAGRAVEPLLARLDDLVRLTPEQNAEAAKIVADESLAPREFSSMHDWLRRKADNDQNARAKILALLIPSQRKLYDDAFKKTGGGQAKGSYPPSAALFRERVSYIGDLIKKISGDRRAAWSGRGGEAGLGSWLDF